ncbi:MAG: hypothetical protein JNM68_10140 [Dinghuibacter sp.]|nr:hypothetical protein [Dinghuibacter sp.]
MKKTVLAFITMLAICSIAPAQLPDTQQEERIKKLETELLQLQENIFAADSVHYAKAYATGLEGVFAFDKLYSEAAMFGSNLSQSSFLLKLMNVNNPSSLELRKRILGDLQQMIESKIADISGPDTVRKRNFFTVVRNIFNNPFVQTAAAIVPIATPVMNVLSAVSSVIAPKVKVEKNGLGAVKNVLLDIEGMLNESPLKDIGNRIMPYLSFYDTLQHLNNEFTRDMAYIRNTTIDIQKSVNRFARQYQELLNWKPGELLNLAIGRLNNAYVSPDQLRTKRTEAAAERIKAELLYETAIPVIQELQRLRELRNNYNDAFSSFGKKYLAVLKKYAAENNLFKQYLEPVIAQLTPQSSSNNNNSNEPQVLMTIAPPSFPAANGYQQPLLDKMNMKYGIAEPGSGYTDYLKKTIF